MTKRTAAMGPVEGPWVLPDGWQWEALGNLGTWSGGGTPSKTRPDFWTDGTIPWVSPKDMKRPLIDSSEDKITTAAVAGSSAKMVPAGSVLCVMRSGILRHTFPVAVNTIDVTLNQDMRALIPRLDVEPRYLAYFLQFTGTTVLHTASKAGTTVNSIEASRLNRHPVPLAGVDRQRAIVARIDELFAEIDDGEAALARARDDLSTWRKSLLKAAVTGELTADWRAANPSTENGAELLANILADRAKVAAKRLGKRRDKVPEEITPAQQELMWTAPKGWTWIQLGNFSFVTKLAGFEYTKYVRYDNRGDLRVIKAENAGVHGFKTTSYSRVLSSNVAELTRSRLHGGELLMVFVGAGTGNVAMVPEGEEFFLGPNIGMMRVETELVSPRYIELFLRSPIGKALATSAMKAVAQPSLSMGTIRQVPILLPPFAEQIEALSRLERAIAATADCDLEVREHEVSATTLRQSILAAAFRGDLV